MSILLILSKEKMKTNNANWESAYDNLYAEIKTRHYSPKTLKSYRSWIVKFQAFAKRKAPTVAILFGCKGISKFFSR